ncbi:MAG: DUF4097 domain-containing protein [Bacteriovoracia bacterium]
MGTIAAVALAIGGSGGIGHATSTTPAVTQDSPGSFSQKTVHDFPLRSIGKLQVSNRHGAVSVKGWSQDKIRVTVVKLTQATDEAEASTQFQQLGLLQRGRGEHFELIAQYGRAMGIEQRLANTKAPKVRLDLEIQAPAKLLLQAWTTGDRIAVKNWHAPVDVRTETGLIQIEEVRAKEVKATCVACGMKIRAISGSVRCLGGSGDIDLRDLASDQIYVETSSGAILPNRTNGNQLYVTQGGAILGKSLNGRVEFQTKSGRVDLSQSAGFASGRTTSGDVRVEMAKWKFLDRAVFESELGQISLKLPSDFSATVDLRTERGKMRLEFPLRVLRDDEESLKNSATRLKGAIGENDHHNLTVYSRMGNVRVLRGS